MLAYALASVICTEFEESVGRFQGREAEPKAMDLEFRLHSKDPEEEGYRHLKLRIFARDNYVSVWVREDYAGGDAEVDTGWLLASHHDSCWRDKVRDILFLYRDQIAYIDTMFQKNGWYTRRVMKPEDVEEDKTLVRMRDSGDSSRQFNDRRWLEQLPLAKSD